MMDRVLKLILFLGILMLIVRVSQQYMQQERSRLDIEVSADYSSALDHLEKALQLNTSQTLIDSLILQAEPILLTGFEAENQEQIRLLYLRSKYFTNLHNSSQARTNLEQAEALIEYADNDIEYAVVMNLLAMYKRSLDNYQPASVLIRKYTSQDHLEQFIHNKATLIAEMASLELRMNKMEASLALFREAQDLALKVSDTSTYVKCLSSLIWLDTNLETEQKITKLLNLISSYPNITAEVKWRLCSNIGDMYYYGLGDYEALYTYMCRQLEAVGQLDEGYYKKRVLALTLSNLADAALMVGKGDDARKWIDSAEVYLAYMHVDWIAHFQDNYTRAHNLSSEEAIAKSTELHNFIRQEHQTAHSSHERYMEARHDLLMEIAESRTMLRQQQARTFRIFLIMSLIILLLIMGYIYLHMYRSRRALSLRQKLLSLTEVFYRGNIQISILDDQLLRAVFQVGSRDPQAPNVLKFFSNEFHYIKQVWEKPLLELTKEIMLTDKLIETLTEDSNGLGTYKGMQIDLEVDSKLKDSTWMVPRYMIKGCMFVAVTCSVDTGVRHIKMTLIKERDGLRLTARLDADISEQLISSQYIEPINEVLRYYHKEDVYISTISNECVISMQVPVK